MPRNPAEGGWTRLRGFLCAERSQFAFCSVSPWLEGPVTT